MNTLKILLSFDHELSLGGATSYSQNMFEPTDELLDLADQLQVPITLFTDICCARRFRDWDRAGFYEPFRKQLDSAIRRGHDVQLHLHPHWIDSEYREGRFVPATTYSLGDYVDREWPDNIPGIIAQGVQLLREMCAADPAYRCLAFRAGGFSLTPQTPAILAALYENGIRIESTIAKGFRYSSNLWEVDFRDMPAAANWYIATSGPLNRESSSGLYEIPIAARPRTPWNNLPFLWNRVLRSGRRFRSGGWPIDTGQVSVAAKLQRLIPRSAWLLGFDHYADNISDLMKTLQYHVTRHARDGLIACSAVSHPKAMGPYARSLMAAFVQRVRAEYGEQASFCTYQQFYDDFLGDDHAREGAKTSKIC